VFSLLSFFRSNDFLLKKLSVINNLIQKEFRSNESLLVFCPVNWPFYEINLSLTVFGQMDIRSNDFRSNGFRSNSALSNGFDQTFFSDMIDERTPQM
jgi:hypothetical protein